MERSGKNRVSVLQSTHSTKFLGRVSPYVLVLSAVSWLSLGDEDIAFAAENPVRQPRLEIERI